MVFSLPTDRIVFPKPELADEDGLLAVGGDLSVKRLLMAYRHGIFPWYSGDEPILWYAPHERCIIYPKKLKISKSLKKTLSSNKFNITVNKSFAQVLKNCAEIPRKGETGTWLNQELQNSLYKLHILGWAYSVEVWQNHQLVGGLYGIKFGRVFCGESMFCAVSDASKVAMVHLCNNMNLELIDCQIPNTHLMSLGAEVISSSAFIEILDQQFENDIPSK